MVRVPYDWAGRYTDAVSDKVYRVRVVSIPGAFLCQRYWGRTGFDPKSMAKTHLSESLAINEARTLTRAKQRGGYEDCDRSLVPIIELPVAEERVNPERSERQRQAAQKAWKTIRAKKAKPTAAQPALFRPRRSFNFGEE